MKKISFEPKAEKLFLSYAYPCSDNPEKVKEEMKKEKPRLNLEKDFPTATGALKVMSKGEKIDEATVLNYFWFKHAEILKESAGNKDKVYKCLVLPGKLLEENEVELVNGERRHVDTQFIDEPEKGDKVVVHYSCVAERIKEEDSGKIVEKLKDLELLS